MCFVIKLWNYLPEDYVWCKFHQNELNICKNLNPLKVVVYDEYYVTISVAVMAFCLMVFYENLNLLGWSIRSVCTTYSWAINHIDDIKWITSERSRFGTENVFWTLWRQTYYFRFARRFLVLENQRDSLLSDKEKITVNRTFNFVSTKKPC